MLQEFVGLMGVSATLVAFWMTAVVLHRRLLQRASVVLTAISGLLMAYFYVALWGFHFLRL